MQSDALASFWELLCLIARVLALTLPTSHQESDLESRSTIVLTAGLNLALLSFEVRTLYVAFAVFCVLNIVPRMEAAWDTQFRVHCSAASTPSTLAY